MTPIRLNEMRCPKCQRSFWVLDSDYRDMSGVFVAFEERDYECPACSYAGRSFVVLRQSPPEFFLQPHPLYPMSQPDFDAWVQILRENFPDHPMLDEVGREFRPSP